MLRAKPSKLGLGTALSALRANGRFRLLWLSNLFFFGGVWTQTLVLGWLAYETTGSEFLVAVFTAARLAPMLLGPIAGAVADRHNRVGLLIIACAWALVTAGAVAGLASFDLLPYWALVAGGLALGLAQSPSQPARSSMVLDLVGRENLSNANALNTMAMNLPQVIGPAAGGALISTLGAPAALWISTAWYGLSLVLLIPLRGLGDPVRHEPERVLSMITGGFRAIARNRLAVAILLVTLAANILLWPIYQSFMPVFAQQSLGLDAAGLGVLLTCCGVGGLVGSLIIAGLGDFRFKGGAFVLGTAGWGLLWAVFAVAQNVTAAYVVMIGIGVLSAVFGVLQTTLLLMTTEPALHGRALGVQELAIGVMPVSALILGVIAQTVGVALTTLCAGLLLAAALILLAVRVPELVRYG
ncbi:MFS transporter [Nonomuraea sp. NPDC050310]|uniref:MFS transporter n=1 Tax=unclassified Nonomuraea TaxID=2593643 RepID=UPI0033F5302B